MVIKSKDGKRRIEITVSRMPIYCCHRDCGSDCSYLGIGLVVDPAPMGGEPDYPYKWYCFKCAQKAGLGDVMAQMGLLW